VIRAGLASILSIIAASTAAAATVEDGHIKHVLLISIDGMHAVDLQKFVAANPNSTLAALSGTGITYTNALTGAGILSDSFPGLASIVTGGGPGSTGLWYDDSWDRSLWTNGAAGPGTETTLFEALDWNFAYVDGGVTANGGTPHYNADAINPANLPTTDGTTAHAVWPHQIERLNTIFEVVKGSGKYTAWCDKHPAYEWVMGPSGTGLNDFYAPEINSWVNADGSVPAAFSTASPAVVSASNNTAGWDLTSSEAAVQPNDSLKAAAIINQIDGKTALGGATTPANTVPALFGMNFQAVSVAQKLRHDPLWATGTTTNQGGYTDATGTPSTSLAGALSFVDGKLGSFVTELKKTAGLYESTLIIITAKHGQSPIDVTTLVVENPSYSTTTTLDPIAGDGTIGTVVSNAVVGTGIKTDFSVSDDVYLIWLHDQGQVDVATNILKENAAAFHIQTIYSGVSLIERFHTDPLIDPRCPDIVIQPIPGTIYNSGKKKVAEHGGASHNDLNVALLLSNASLSKGTVTDQVLTTQIAPTILKALGIDPTLLDATTTDGTVSLEYASNGGGSGSGGTTGVPAVSSSSSKKCGMGGGTAALLLTLGSWLVFRSLRRR
jgi:predicted AlkP superfamily pyrophosphatase or phosphodiesterase